MGEGETGGGGRRIPADHCNSISLAPKVKEITFLEKHGDGV